MLRSIAQYILKAIIGVGILVPASADVPDQNMELFLELTVNGVPTYHLALVDYQKPYFYINEGDLSETPIVLSEMGDIKPGQRIPINKYKEVTVHYDEELQTLDIDVPASWLPRQQIGRAREALDAKMSTGALLNYDSYFSHSQGKTNLNIWNEVRTFGDYGTFSSSGTFQTNVGGSQSHANRYRRYDTYWEYSNEEKLYTVRVGDLITRPLTWSSAVRLGGAQISHNFSLRPDLITYPLPEFSGEVGLPSTLDLLVNGNKQYSQSLNPGPFDVNQVTHLNGAGEAVVVTTDALGRTVSINVPFYVTSRLLKKGLFDYTVSAGSLREHYGQKNFSYSRYAIDSSMRYGLTDEWTLEAHAEMGTSLQVIGAGVVTNVGRIGLINASLMATNYQGKVGNQLYLGYEYVHPQFGVRASYRKRSQNYRDIASIDSNGNMDTESMQISFNKNFAEFGNMSIGYFSNKTRDDARQNSVSLGWSKSLKEYGSVYAYVNRSNDRSNRWTASVQWSIPVGIYSSLSASANKNDNNQDNYALNYSRTVPSDGGIGWRMNYNHYNNQDDYYNGAILYRNEKFELDGGFYGTRKDQTYWADLSGALVFLDGQVMASNQVNDSFVLISTDGAPDVDVKFENRVIGKTNKDGYLLVSKVPSYYDAKYEIDALGLPFNMQVPVLEQKIAVKTGGGYTLEFPVDTTTPMTLTLVDRFGEVIEIGSHVVTNYGEDSFVGWDGIVFFEYLEEENTLTVALPEGGRCEALVSLSGSTESNEEDGIVHLGNYECL